MYNPSDHIPLAKPLGAAAFPIDGKFMFYTNGAGGVFAYRPFQSVTEVLGYFPLGSPFRGNPFGQPWAFEILVNTGGTLSNDGGSIVGGVNDVYWWRNGVTDADLVLKASGGSASTVIHRSFTIPESDITEGVVSLAGRTNDQGDQIIPSKATWAVETEDGSVGRYSNTTQTVDGLGSGGIEVYLVGVEGVEPAGLSLQNTTDKILKYAINSFVPLDLAIGDSITVSPGNSLVLFLESASSSTYFLSNQSGTLTNTDGISVINDQPQEWIIPIDSTSLTIIQPL